MLFAVVDPLVVSHLAVLITEKYFSSSYKPFATCYNTRVAVLTKCLFLSPNHLKYSCSSLFITYIIFSKEAGVLKLVITSVKSKISVAKMLGVFIRSGSALKTNCSCRIVQTFKLPKLSHYIPVWYWVGKIVIYAPNTILQAARIALRQKTATLSKNAYEATGLLSFHMYPQYKCLCQ